MYYMKYIFETEFTMVNKMIHNKFSVGAKKCTTHV